MSTRREFLQCAGAGAAISLLSGRTVFAQYPDSDAKPVLKPSPKKRAFDLGIATYTFREFPFDKMLAMTKRVGLTHMCIKNFHLPLDSSPEKIKQTAAAVRAAGIDLYGCGPIPMKNEAEVNQAFEYAKNAGARVLVAVPAPDVLPLVSRKAKQYDIRVAIHNHGPDEKTFSTPGMIIEKVKDLDPRVGLCMDIGHTIRAGVDPSVAAERYADRLFDVHMKDVSAAAKRGNTVEAGRGVIDLPRFFRTLEKIGYAGILAFEFEKDEKDPLPGLAEAVGYTRGVLAAM